MISLTDAGTDLNRAGNCGKLSPPVKIKTEEKTSCLAQQEHKGFSDERDVLVFSLWDSPYMLKSRCVIT